MYVTNLRNVSRIQKDYLEKTNPFMDIILDQPVSFYDKQMLSVEIFLAAIDTISTTLAFTLYYLARNPLVQEKARREVLEKQKLFEMTYLRSCIKETLRMCPIAEGNARYLPEPTVINGYTIAKNVFLC